MEFFIGDKMKLSTLQSKIRFWTMLVLLFHTYSSQAGNSSSFLWSTRLGLYDSLVVGEAYMRQTQIPNENQYTPSEISVIDQTTCTKYPEFYFKDPKCYSHGRFKFSCPGNSFISGIKTKWAPKQLFDDNFYEQFDRSYGFYCRFLENQENKQLVARNCNDFELEYKCIGQVSYPYTPFETPEDCLSEDDDQANNTKTMIKKISNATLECPGDQFIKGIKSQYRHGDRKRDFSLQCCDLRDWYNKKYTIPSNAETCQTLSQTAKYKDFDLECPSNTLLKEISIVQDHGQNYKHDYLFTLKCCKAETTK